MKGKVRMIRIITLSSQMMSLEEHQNRKNFRDNRARRHKKKRDRLILMLWTVFARSEGRVLFGDLRIKVEWEHLEKKLCIERKVKKKKTKLAIDWYFCMTSWGHE